MDKLRRIFEVLMDEGVADGKDFEEFERAAAFAARDEKTLPFISVEGRACTGDGLTRLIDQWRRRPKTTGKIIEERALAIMAEDARMTFDRALGEVERADPVLVKRWRDERPVVREEEITDLREER